MTQYKINLNQTTGFSSESTTQHHWTSVHMWMNVFPRLFSFVTFMKNINNSELHAAANRAVCLNLRAIKSARTHTRSWIMSADLWRSACPDSSQSAPTSWPRACVCVCEQMGEEWSVILMLSSHLLLSDVSPLYHSLTNAHFWNIHKTSVHTH